MRSFRIIALFVALAAIAAIGAQSAQARSPAIGVRYASSDHTYTGWAKLDNVPCVNGNTVSVYCSYVDTGLRCAVAPCPSSRGDRIYAYSYQYAQWFLLPDEFDAYVYATPQTSDFAWIWNPRYGFLVAQKSLIRTSSTPATRPCGMTVPASC